MNKILIVEDDQMLVEIYQKKFETEGFDVETARNGSEAIKKIHQFMPDLVLLDLVMPEEDGFDVLKKIKASPTSSKVKIVVFSNLSQDEDVEKAKKMGAVGFITKSDFTPQEVVKKVQHLLKSGNDNDSGKEKEMIEVSEKKKENGMKILLIEYDDVFSKVFSDKLEQSGFDIHAEKDFDQGLDVLKNQEFEICILSCSLDVDEEQAVEIFSQVKKKNGIKIIIFFNQDLESKMNPSLSEQADLILDKTKITPGELIQKIGELG